MSPVAVSFDLDETLLDNSFIPETIASCCALAAARLGVSADEVSRANAEVWSASWPASEAGLALGTMTGAALRHDVWRQALAACGGEDATLLDDVLAEHVRLDDAAARLFEDVAPAMDALRSAGVPLALITNGPSDTQRSRLASLGMASWFDAVVISAEVGAVKPDAAVFAVAAAGLGVDGRDLWHVGDNLATDVAGALASGHTAVWLNRRHQVRDAGDPAPDLELSSLADLPRCLP